MIELKNIKKSFGDQIVLGGITYTFPSKGMFVLRGANMVGKSTLLYIIDLLDHEYSGSLFIDGNNINIMNEKERMEFREKNIFFILPQNNLIPNLSPVENIRLCGNDSDSLPSFLPEYLLSYKDCFTLSGGEEMIVALAGCVLSKKRILLLDEPTYSLSYENKIKVLELLKEISKNSLVLFSSHDEVTFSECTNLFLKEGKLVLNK